MTITHIPYETAKRIKAFLGDGAVEPMGRCYWDRFGLGVGVYEPPEDRAPAYRLEDLLSKSFCNAIAEKRYLKLQVVGTWLSVWGALAKIYPVGGLPAVCEELERMMEGK